jgi:hypothetical protein
MTLLSTGDSVRRFGHRVIRTGSIAGGCRVTRIDSIAGGCRVTRTGSIAGGCRVTRIGANPCGLAGEGRW